MFSLCRLLKLLFCKLLLGWFRSPQTFCFLVCQCEKKKKQQRYQDKHWGPSQVRKEMGSVCGYQNELIKSWTKTLWRGWLKLVRERVGHLFTLWGKMSFHLWFPEQKTKISSSSLSYLGSFPTNETKQDIYASKHYETK